MREYVGKRKMNEAKSKVMTCSRDGSVGSAEIALNGEKLAGTGGSFHICV